MNAPLIWFLLGAALFVAELMTPTLVLLFFGVGAWAASLGALLGLDLNWQLALFISVTLLTLLVLRRRVRAVFSGRSFRSAEGGVEHPKEHPLAGRMGVASKALRPGEVGEVSIDGSFWRAVSRSAVNRGAAVRVLGSLPGDALVLCVAATNAPHADDAPPNNA